MMGYGGYGGYGMMGYGWGWLMMIGVVILVVLGIVVLFRYLQSSGKPTSRTSGSNALDILNERYARGEISNEEYNRTKADILK